MPKVRARLPLPLEAAVELFALFMASERNLVRCTRCDGAFFVQLPPSVPKVPQVALPAPDPRALAFGVPFTSPAAAAKEGG